MKKFFGRTVFFLYSFALIFLFHEPALAQYAAPKVFPLGHHKSVFYRASGSVVSAPDPVTQWDPTRKTGDDIKKQQLFSAFKASGYGHYSVGLQPGVEPSSLKKWPITGKVSNTSLAAAGFKTIDLPDGSGKAYLINGYSNCPADSSKGCPRLSLATGPIQMVIVNSAFGGIVAAYSGTHKIWIVNSLIDGTEDLATGGSSEGSIACEGCSLLFIAYSEIMGGADAMKLHENTTVYRSHIHGQIDTANGAPHNDGIQSSGGATNIFLIENHCELFWGEDNGCYWFETNFGPNGPIYVYGNMIHGGHSGIRAVRKTAGSPWTGALVIKDNLHGVLGVQATSTVWSHFDHASGSLNMDPISIGSQVTVRASGSKGMDNKELPESFPAPIDEDDSAVISVKNRANILVTKIRTLPEVNLPDPKIDLTSTPPPLSPPGGPVVVADTTAPTVTFLAPAHNTIASGPTLQLSVRATDNVGVTKVEFSLYPSTTPFSTDNSADTNSAYQTTLNLTAAMNGLQRVVAKAYDAAGNTTGMFVTITVSVPVSTTTAYNSSATNTVIPFASAQSGNFTVQFDAMAMNNLVNSAIGLSGVSKSTADYVYTDMAVIARFSDEISPARIDALDSAKPYRSDVTLSYQSAKNYHFRMVVDVPTKKFSIFVKPDGESEISLAQDYDFRSEQLATAKIDRIILKDMAGKGYVRVSNLSVVASESTPPVIPTTKRMRCPGESIVQSALNTKFIAFKYKSAPGNDHYTTSEENGEFAKGAMAFCGDSRADIKLLEQIRHILVPGNEILATGGYQDQKQVGALGMFLFAKNTSRIWSQLSVGEQRKINVIMKAVLVSSAFTTSDENTVWGGRVDGSSTNHRDGNPNYPNGMVGSVIIAALYFGVDAARSILLNHDHSAFKDEVAAAGVTNLSKTYSHLYYTTGPSDADIEFVLHKEYKFHGISLANLMGLRGYLSGRTFSRPVQCGLNNNQGVVADNGIRGGYMRTGCSGLPNKGLPGMLFEFNSNLDSGGIRSATSYGYSGMYPLVFVDYVLIAFGKWVDSASARSDLNKLKIGKDDLHYKLDSARGGGYHDIYNGKGYGEPRFIDSAKGHLINFSLTDDVVATCGSGC